MRTLKSLGEVLLDAVRCWQDDNVPRLAAALSYYTIFSLTPLLIIAIAIAGTFLERQELRQQILLTAHRYVGAQGAQFVQAVLDNMTEPRVSTFAGGVSLLILLFGASNVFAQLKGALNTIMNVVPKPELGITSFIRDRIFALFMVIVVGIILLVAVIVTTTISVISENPLVALPGGNQIWLLLNTLASWIIFTALFATLYKWVPDVKVAWRDVVIGAGVGALLFIVGQFLITFYLRRFGLRSVYGAAGSTIVILLWVYVAAQIIFFGAEFTQAFANRVGSGVKPADNAVPVIEVRRDELEKHTSDGLSDLEV